MMPTHQSSLLRCAFALVVVFLTIPARAQDREPTTFWKRIKEKGIYERICEFASALGSQWTPAPLLRRLAEEGRCFADFDQR